MMGYLTHVKRVEIIVEIIVEKAGEIRPDHRDTKKHSYSNWKITISEAINQQLKSYNFPLSLSLSFGHLHQNFQPKKKKNGNA